MYGGGWHLFWFAFNVVNSSCFQCLVAVKTTNKIIHYSEQ